MWVEPKGVLLHDCQICEPAPHASNPEFAERLWKLSEELVKQEFKFVDSWSSSDKEIRREELPHMSQNFRKNLPRKHDLSKT
jgi:hypothetical protein